MEGGPQTQQVAFCLAAYCKANPGCNHKRKKTPRGAAKQSAEITAHRAWNRQHMCNLDAHADLWLTIARSIIWRTHNVTDVAEILRTSRTLSKLSPRCLEELKGIVTPQGNDDDDPALDDEQNTKLRLARYHARHLMFCAVGRADVCAIVLSHLSAADIARLRWTCRWCASHPQMWHASCAWFDRRRVKVYFDGDDMWYEGTIQKLRFAPRSASRKQVHSIARVLKCASVFYEEPVGNRGGIPSRQHWEKLGELTKDPEGGLMHRVQLLDERRGEDRRSDLRAPGEGARTRSKSTRVAYM